MSDISDLDDDEMHAVPPRLEPLNRAGVAVEALDRELAFYRRRAGQVFFIGLLVEVLITGGKEKIDSVPSDVPWVHALVYSIFFVAVATISSVLGSEYRKRIHDLKNVRREIMNSLYPNSAEAYTQVGGATLSEIQVLYVVLIFLSSCGTILSWWKAYEETRPVDCAVFWVPFILFVGASALGIAYATVVVANWSIRSIRQQQKMTSGS